MRNPERLAAVQEVLRQKHEKLHALETDSVASLQAAIDAEGRAVDATRDVFASARLAFIEARQAVTAAKNTLHIISEAQDAIAALYASDNDLEHIVKTDTP